MFLDGFYFSVSVDKPQFLPDQVSYAYTWAGQHHVLECRLLAEPVATVDWFVRGVKLENNDTFHIISSDSNSSLEVCEESVVSYCCIFENLGL